MPNYERLAKTAERLIAKNGRKVTFSWPKSEPLDQNKPWKGSSRTDRLNVDLMAVFVTPSANTQFGMTALGEGTEIDDLFKSIELTAMLFPGDHDVRKFTSMTDFDGTEYGIIAYQLLQPANTKLIAYLGMRR